MVVIPSFLTCGVFIDKFTKYLFTDRLYELVGVTVTFFIVGRSVEFKISSQVCTKQMLGIKVKYRICKVIDVKRYCTSGLVEPMTYTLTSKQMH